MILTPHSGTRRLSYDLDAPLPWKSEVDSARQPSITPRTSIPSAAAAVTTDPFNDDHLFTPAIKPKPRTSLQTKSDDTPMDFNATIRRPTKELHQLDWLTETPAISNVKEDQETQKSPSPPPTMNDEDEKERVRSPSPTAIDDDYGADDFEEEDSQ